MKRNKLISIGLPLLGVIVGGIYFGAPLIAEDIIRGIITEDLSNQVGEIDITWSGPQTISGLQITHEYGSANLDVSISNSLVSLVSSSSVIDVVAKGSAIVQSKQQIETDSNSSSTPSTLSVTKTESSQQKSRSSFPAINLVLELTSITIDGNEPLIYSDVHATCRVNPGRHFSVELSATTDTDGTIEVTGNAPDILTSDGNFNSEASATCTFEIVNAALPTIQGAGGWSIIKMNGSVSSPNLKEAINVSLSGKFAEYDTPRGHVEVKTQLLSTKNKNGAFIFDGRELVGSIDLTDVPTTVLAPLLSAAKINTMRDLGPTMQFRMQRTLQGPPLQATFNTRDVQISGIVDSDYGTITDIDIVAHMNSEFLDDISNGQITGDADITLHLDTLVPVGYNSDEGKECVGHVRIEGDLKYLPSNISIQALQADFSADMTARSMRVDGSATIDGNSTSFDVALRSSHKNKLDGLDDLWKTITRQLPQGEGDIQIKNLSTSLFQAYAQDSPIVLTRDIGETVDLVAALQLQNIAIDAKSKHVHVTGVVELQGDQMNGFSNVNVDATIGKELATDLSGVAIDSNASLHTTIKSLDLIGNSTFDATLDVGKQHTVVQGVTTRSKEGVFNVNLAATGIDTRLLDAVYACNGLLVDSIGSPLSVEIQAKDVLGTPIILAGGTSKNATFDTSFTLFDGQLSTLLDTTTRSDLQLSSSLTQHLLKDLGPVLADIRSVKHPIQMTLSDVHVSLEGDLSKFNADVLIDIGEVELDSGSITMDLLPLFNSSHKEHIPAFFDPIKIEIRKGIATYKKFDLTIAGKYSIPYSGTINFVNRELHLKSAIPLTGLGYSIKELRGLATDIDVPILITGTIDVPKVDIDPEFDLTKLLQSAAIDAIGDAIGDALGGGGGEAPDPLKLLEDLLGGK